MNDTMAPQLKFKIKERGSARQLSREGDSPKSHVTAEKSSRCFGAGLVSRDEIRCLAHFSSFGAMDGLTGTSTG